MRDFIFGRNKKKIPGIKLPHMKNTEALDTVKMPVPEVVRIPMKQHMGQICDILIKPKDKVLAGQVIGESKHPFSAPVHSSVSGEVIAVENTLTYSGDTVKCAVIKTDGLQTLCGDIKPPEYNSKEKFLDAVYRSGLVGLGGAGFPTHIKFRYKEEQKIHTLILNGAECEPYITSDNREMLEKYDEIIRSVDIICGVLGIPNVVIGIEDNKKEAINLLRTKTKEHKNISIISLDSKYPGGAEKVLIYKCTGIVLKEGQIPADAGVVVLNTTTAASLYRFLKTGIPLISRRITVDGDVIKNPANIEVLIGSSVKDIIDFCGGFFSEPKKVLAGGPMMGQPLYDLNTPVIKTANAILAFSEEYVKTHSYKTTACIKCGKCIRACPLSLMPRALESAYDRRDIGELEKFKASLCVNCGSCSYVCPAKRELSYKNQLAKALLREASLKKS